MDTSYVWRNGRSASDGKDLPHNNGQEPAQGKFDKSQLAVESRFVWMDKELVPMDKATVHFLNPTLHYGLGVFEGIRCYETKRGRAAFRLREHLERFTNSVRVLGVLDFDYTIDELREAVYRTVRSNGLDNCYVRLMLYFQGPLSLGMDAYISSIAISAWEWDPLLGADKIQSGVRLMVSSYTRMHPNASMTKAKISGQYVNPILAKTVAQRAGFDEAVLLDPEGYVAECSGENLLLVKDGKIYVSPAGTIMEGITRDSLITLARDSGYQVEEKRISRDQLYIADEIFVCGTAAEVVPVREIDYRPIGSGQRGPITSKIQELFRDTVHGKGARSREWLDYMITEPVV